MVPVCKHVCFFMFYLSKSGIVMWHELWLTSGVMGLRKVSTVLCFLFPSYLYDGDFLFAIF